MPSPFPGMDPYLEHPRFWPNLHHSLITHLEEALNGLLPPRYVASTEVRVYAVELDREVVPDVMLVERKRKERGLRPAATIECDPPTILQVPDVEVREGFVDVVDTTIRGKVVATIEVLSPFNKMAGPGRDKYLAKQRAMLKSAIHLLEIDLLRSGSPTVAAQVELLSSGEPWHYAVCLHRGREGGRFEVWPFSLRQRFPRVSVPLAGDDPDVVLDLGKVFDETYDRSAFARKVDYSKPPRVALEKDDAAWSSALLRARRRKTVRDR